MSMRHNLLVVKAPSAKVKLDAVSVPTVGKEAPSAKDQLDAVCAQRLARQAPSTKDQLDAACVPTHCVCNATCVPIHCGSFSLAVGTYLLAGRVSANLLQNDVLMLVLAIDTSPIPPSPVHCGLLPCLFIHNHVRRRRGITPRGSRFIQ